MANRILEFVLLFTLTVAGTHFAGPALTRMLGLPGSVAFPVVGIPIVVGRVVLGIVWDSKLRREWRSFIRGFGHRLAREWQLRDFAAARAAAGSPGRVFATGNLVVWTDSPEDLARMAETAYARTVEAFRRLTACEPNDSRPLRLICFERDDAFVAYTSAIYPGFTKGMATGFYDGIFRKRVFVSAETARLRPRELESILAHEFAHHLTRTIARRIPTWIDEGLSECVSIQVSRSRGAPGALQRRFQAERARGAILRGSNLVRVTRHDIWRCLKRIEDPDAAAFIGRYYAQSGLLFDFVMPGRGVEFRSLIAAARKAEQNPDALERLLEMSLDDAMQRALDPFLKGAPPPFTPPDDDSKAMIDRLVEVMLNLDSDTLLRRLAICCMASIGYPWRADALIWLLDEPDARLRADSARALENIAGELRSADSNSWRAWFDALPPDVTGRARKGSRT